MKQFGFIGMGNMASAIFEGMNSVFPKDEFIFSEVDNLKAEVFGQKNEVARAKNNPECVQNAKYIILAEYSIIFPKIFLSDSIGLCPFRFWKKCMMKKVGQT